MPNIYDDSINKTYFNIISISFFVINAINRDKNH